nr:uncharacterized protein LOC129380986 isoform X2 [Dermacentor andersoni]
MHAAAESVRYLRHVLTRHGLSLDPQRLEDILQVQTPSNQEELQTFLGMAADTGGSSGLGCCCFTIGPVNSTVASRMSIFGPQ